MHININVKEVFEIIKHKISFTYKFDVYLNIQLVLFYKNYNLLFNNVL